MQPNDTTVMCTSWLVLLNIDSLMAPSVNYIKLKYNTKPSRHFKYELNAIWKQYVMHLKQRKWSLKILDD
jgi:hypothetical protein